MTSWTGKCAAKCRDSKQNQSEQKTVDKDRRPLTVDRVSSFSVDTKFIK